MTLPRLGSAATAVAALLSLSACGLTSPLASHGSGDPGTAHAPSAAASAAATPVALRTNIPHSGRGVAVDHVVKVSATGGTIEAVDVTSKDGKLPGSLNHDATAWTATQLLEPATTYSVVVHGRSRSGHRTIRRSSFTTQQLTLAQQTYPSVSPLAGSTVGIGMPVVVHFDVPVHNEALFEKHMTVTSEPAQKGSWYWISDTEAHWRPEHFWKAGSKVQVHLDVNSLPAGDGVYGQENRDIDFSIGAAHIYKVNMRTDQMQVFSNGRLIRTLPVTTGKPGFETRSGIKVIEAKFPSVEMNSETIGIEKSNPNYYDLDNVQWAMRLTNSGEFIHAAPWSEAEQGHENVSHGCTGLSTANAEWLYDMSIPGDVVEEYGNSRPMEFTNGFGDWNKSWKDYQEGSALARGTHS